MAAWWREEGKKCGEGGGRGGEKGEGNVACFVLLFVFFEFVKSNIFSGE